ncbi:MAG: hypothetical protein AABY22_11620 [Nanoarchaeota archaeon]
MKDLDRYDYWIDHKEDIIGLVSDMLKTVHMLDGREDLTVENCRKMRPRWNKMARRFVEDFIEEKEDSSD